MHQTIMQVVGNGDPGGGTTAVLTLAQMLQQEGRAPMVVSQQGSYLLAEAASHGIPIHGLGFSSRKGAIASFHQLAALIRQHAPAVVHAHGNRAGLPVAMAMKLLRKNERPRFVYTVHGFHFLSKKGVAFQLARLAERFCIQAADWTNFVSRGDADIASVHRFAVDPARSEIIHNAVMTQDLPVPPAAREAGDIAFLGRLAYQKNPLILPDIVARLQPLAVRMHVIGGGDMEAELKAKVAAMGLGERFVFHGQQPRDAALRLAAACRTLFLPSRWEGHPITVIEAMHMGMPVVASDIPGTREIIGPGRTGYLVSPEDCDGYADALRRLLVDPAHARAMGEAGRLAAQQNFSVERMVEANLLAYRLAPTPAAG